MENKIVRRVLQEFHTLSKVKGRSGINLTSRESEVLSLLDKGHTTKEIGNVLSIKYETIRSHLKHVYKKLHAHSMPDAIAKGKGKWLICYAFFDRMYWMVRIIKVLVYLAGPV